MIKKTHTLHTGGPHGRWSGFALDTFFGPHLSELTACTAPEVPEMPPYLTSFALNRGVFSTVDDKHKAKLILAASYIRHSSSAIIEYRDGTGALRRYVAALREPSSLRDHELAVARFQNCLIQASAGQSCLGAIRAVEHSLERLELYDGDDGSVRYRLAKLANRVRHFEGDIRAATKKPPYSPFPLAPIWLTNTGLAGRSGSTVYEMTFHELADYLVAATADARALSESTFIITEPTPS